MPQAAHQHSTQKSERSICVSQDWYDMRGTPIVLDVFIPRLGSKRWTDVETLGSLRSQVRKGSLIAQGKLERLVRAPTYLGGFILTSGGWHVRAYSQRVRPHLFFGRFTVRAEFCLILTCLLSPKSNRSEFCLTFLCPSLQKSNKTQDPCAARALGLLLGPLHHAEHRQRRQGRRTASRSPPSPAPSFCPQYFAHKRALGVHLV